MTTDTYNPTDFTFETKHAMRFVKKLNREKFNEFLHEYGVSFTKRPKQNIFFREELEEALRKERKALGSNK